MIPAVKFLEYKRQFEDKARDIRISGKYPFYAWCCKNVPGYKTMRGNLAFRKKILLKAGSDIKFKSDLYAMCARDPLFHINGFVWTYDPRLPKEKTIPFITYDFQDADIDETIEKVRFGGDLLVEKSRDMGASWIILTCFEWLWHFHNGMSFLLGSRTEDYVDKRGDRKSLMWKIDCILEKLPKWLVPEFFRISMHFENLDTGSTIEGESTTGDFARGGRYSAIMNDEFAAVEPDGSRVLKATRDATRTRIFNSTHQGANTSFYRLSKTNIPKLVLHWSAHPEKCKGLYYSLDGQIKMLDDFHGEVTVDGKKYHYPEDYPFQRDGKLRSPWYDNECSRAEHPIEIAQELDIDPFSSDFQYFDPNMIELIEKENVCQPYQEGMIEFDEDTCDPLSFIAGNNGQLKLWVHLDFSGRIDPLMEVGCGVDIAAGTGASNSAMSFVNLRTGEKIAEYADPWIKPESFAKVAIALCKFFNDAFMIPDGAGTGRIFCDELLRLGYRNLYYRRNEEGISKKVSDKPGVFLVPKEKKAVLGQYRRALKDRTYIQRSHEANQECLQYIYTTGNSVEHSSALNTIDPSGAGDSHGDRVVSDALANKCVEFLNKRPKKGEVGKMPQNCYAAIKHEREQKEKRSKEW